MSECEPTAEELGQEVAACLAGADLTHHGLVRLRRRADEVAARLASTVDHAPEVATSLSAYLARRLYHLLATTFDAGREQVRPVPGTELHRLLVGTCKRWANEMRDLVLRVQAELSVLSALFHDGSHVRLLSVETGLSDPHHGGRTVHILHFEGFNVVYKPRVVETEQLLQAFVGWFGERLGVQMHTPVQLSREGYAWCEHVEVFPFCTSEQLRSFFERAGFLAFAFYLLGVTDCHVGNVSTTCSGPVLLDGETALHPDLRPELVPWRQPEDGVLRSGLAHGLAPLAQRFSGQQTMVHAFTQAMQIVRADQALRDAVEAWLNAFAGCRTRVVVRATRYYWNLLTRSLAATCLNSTARRRACLRQGLMGTLAPWEGRRSMLPLVEGELQSLADLDIPHVTTTTDGTSLVVDRVHVVADPIALSGLETAHRRLHTLDEQDLPHMQTLLYRALGG